MVVHRAWSLADCRLFFSFSYPSFLLGEAADAALVYWSVLVGLSFCRQARQFKSEEASFFILFNGVLSERECKVVVLLSDRRHVERMETESCDLFTFYHRLVGNFSHSGATFSSVRLVPALVVAVMFGRKVTRVARLLAVTTKFNFVVIPEAHFLVSPLQMGC